MKEKNINLNTDITLTSSVKANLWNIKRFHHQHFPKLCSNNHYFSVSSICIWTLIHLSWGIGQWLVFDTSPALISDIFLFSLLYTFLSSPERRDVICHVWVGGGRGVFLSPSTSFLGKCPWRKVAIRGGTTHHTRGHFSSHYCSSAPIQTHIWLHMDTYCLRGILYVFSNDTLPYIYGSWLPCHVWRNPVRFESQGIQEFQSVNRSIIYIGTENGWWWQWWQCW